MSKRAIITALAAVLILAPGSLLGQRPGRNPLRGQGRGRIEMEQRVRANFQRRLFADLGLTNDERSSVQGVMATFRERRVDFARRERRTRERVRRLQARRADGEAIPDSEASAALEAITQLRQEEAQLFRDEQAALLQTLRPDQVLRLLQARDALADRIRRLRRGGGAQGGMAPGGGRGPGRNRPGGGWSPG
ncbi:MAG: hypothetical protein BMS9Abin29_1830 [Gemmatimonadota bacterium]|nr:MAG: hypothetical protein BMS9Abin29_1830 [Gemmatimonadota bacterium]